MEIRIERGADAVVVKPIGRIDASSAEECRCAYIPLVEAGETVVLDLGAVTFLGSTGLRGMIQAAKILKPRGGKLALRNLPAAVRQVLDLAGVAGLFEVAEPAGRG